MVGPVSHRVITEIAEREGIDPAKLDPPLYTVIDPEALDTLFESDSETDRTQGEVRFEYAGYSVTVYADHSVMINSSQVQTGVLPPAEESHDPEPVD